MDQRLNEFRAGHATIAVGNKIYVFGGYDPHHNNGVEEGIKAECLDLDSVNKGWNYIEKKMPAPLRYHGIALVGNFIYLIGGYSRGDYAKTVYKFDHVYETWSDGINLNEKRCTTCVSLDNKIYALGIGSQEYWGSVETFDLATNKWSIKQNVLNSMIEGGSTLRAVILDQTIYIIGGCWGYQTFSLDLESLESSNKESTP